MANIHCIFLMDFYYTAEQLADAGVDDTAFRVCTEVDSFEWEGNTYFGGGRVLKLSPVPISKEPTNDRITLTLSNVPDDAQRLYSYDAGIVPYRLRTLISTDGGVTYTADGGGISGRLGSPVFRGSTIEVPLESRDADISLAVPVTWSDEGQQARHPGDKGFEFARGLADSFTSSWA